MYSIMSNKRETFMKKISEIKENERLRELRTDVCYGYTTLYGVEKCLKQKHRKDKLLKQLEITPWTRFIH
jgi:hypothetical protein